MTRSTHLKFRLGNWFQIVACPSLLTLVTRDTVQSGVGKGEGEGEGETVIFVGHSNKCD